MSVGVNEVLIEQDRPLCMEHLMLAVREEGFSRASACSVMASKILKSVRQLRCQSVLRVGRQRVVQD